MLNSSVRSLKAYTVTELALTIFPSKRIDQEIDASKSELLPEDPQR